MTLCPTAWFRRTSLALALLLIFLPASTNAAAPRKTKAAAAVEKFFAGDALLQIKIEAAEEAVDILRKYQWQFGETVEREAVQVTVREGANVYTNVALHLKGAAGSFRPVDDKPAMTLNFEKFAKGQKFQGLSKLSLNNSVQDSTYVSEQLCRELFLKAGVPVPRATQVLVELNGRDLGLYVLAEGWDREFLKRHFTNPRGNLYDGGFLQDVTHELATNSGDSKDQSRRIALAEAAQEQDLNKRRERLEAVLDIERFLTFVALDVMLWDWDGYPLNRNNWRLYHDLETDRLIFMPHGLDQMFWKPEGSILPPMQGLVAKAVLQIPELRQRYFARLKELRASVFQPETMVARARTIAAKFSPHLRKTSPDFAKEQASALADFCDAILRRGRSLDQQLAHPIEPAVFDPAGFARLGGWEGKTDFGFPELSKESETNAATPSGALVIGARRGSSIGSWRASLWLEQGRYRLLGRIKTDGIVADAGDPRGGAGVRIGRNRPQDYLLGNSDWKAIEHEFSIDDPLTEVQIICEFRGAQGQAWFDVESLRLKKTVP